MDILEKSLYNGLISGVGMDGKSFFYTNAMEIKNIYQHKDMEAAAFGLVYMFLLSDQYNTINSFGSRICLRTKEHRHLC